MVFFIFELFQELDLLIRNDRVTSAAIITWVNKSVFSLW